MVLPQQLIFNHPDHIPTHFGALKIIGTAGETIRQYRDIHATIPRDNCNNQGNVAIPSKTPVLSFSNQVKNIYQSNNFAQIKQLENMVNNDLTPVYDNISLYPNSAWVKVENNSGVQYYMSWSQNGAVYSYTQPIVPSFNMSGIIDGNAKYVATTQFGIYSNSTNIIGTHSISLGLPQIAVRSSVALAVAQTFGSFVRGGLGFNASQFALRLNENASKVGLGTYFKVPKYAVGQLVESLTFTIVFVGLRALYAPEGRTRVAVFNWDNISHWQFTLQKLNGTHYPGLTDPTLLAVDTQKLSKVIPPVFNQFGDHNITASVPYTVFVYQKDPESENSSFAIQALRSNVSHGFTYAFDRSKGKAGQYIEGTVQLPSKFLSSVGTKWQSSPLTVAASTGDNVPISVTLDSSDATAPGQLLNVNIHINKATVKSCY
ncbi:hypothetical protein CYY_003367 [Polysphondylium violaceum]|uniref:Uncharacterized protein n=1 Tax=Polysphondylium violaceum TaxID=133409 RepID=A0A8J4PWJ1_9MYCE|nr:hypothetical protein CYY_003367 [Polysphondylium violaceum]